MNCSNHVEVQATGFCRSCGKALCPACQRLSGGTIFCAEHAPAVQAMPEAASGTAQNPYNTPWTVAGTATPAPQSTASPGLAFLLGLIPGVGAIYNGQYVKGLIHVLILGLLISIENSGASRGFEPLFGMLITLWFFYMAFEAYHTAKKRQRGEIVDEFSSLVPLRGANAAFPVAPVLLIAIGVLFLLHNLDLLRLYHLLRYWPVFLIALGLYLLYVRVSPSAEAPLNAAPSNTEVTDERH